MKRITLKWTQRGHNTLDPTGTREFDLSVTWAVVADEDLELWCSKARQYADTQPNWVSYKVSFVDE